MTLSEAARGLIRETLEAAPRGSRTAAVERLAASLGVSPGTVWRAARVGGPPRKRQPLRPEYREWTRIAVRIARRAPRPAPLDLAIEAGVASGELPPEAASMPPATAHRIAREELGLRRMPLHRRMSAEYPMQAVQIDGSTSERLHPVREEGGDWVLRLVDRPWRATGYKNKPLGPGRERVGLYAVWDMCTGCVAARYVVERGESALGALEALCGLLAGDGSSDPRRPMHGVPDDLWSDLGPLDKSAAARDLLRRLGIALITGEPYRSTRMGGVERTHRTRWSRLERALHLRREREITLTELNARLAEYEARENALRPSRTAVAGRRCSRAEAWTALVRTRPEPLRMMPEDPIGTMALEARRRVDVAGIVRWGGAEYEVEASAAARLAGGWVIARRAAAGGAGEITVECETTGERALARPWTARPYGEVRSAPATPLEALRATDAAAPERPGADIYAQQPVGQANAGAGNVVPLRAPSAPAAPLANPLAADRHPDLENAMRAFAELCPLSLSARQRRQVAAHLERQGLSRRSVIDLAARLTRTAAGGESG